MIQILETLIAALVNLGIAALVPIGFFAWLIWFFLRLIIGNPIKSHKKYKKLAQGEKNARKSLDKQLVEMGIDPKEFNKKDLSEKLAFWREVDKKELIDNGINPEEFEKLSLEEQGDIYEKIRK